MKVTKGQVPHLPWWRCLAMTDEEIKEFNSKYLVEVEMKDDSLSDVQPLDIGAKMGMPPIKLNAP